MDEYIGFSEMLSSISLADNLVKHGASLVCILDIQDSSDDLCKIVPLSIGY